MDPLFVLLRLLFLTIYTAAVKALAHFGDGDLFKLTAAQKDELTRVASQNPFSLLNTRRLSVRLSPEEH